MKGTNTLVLNKATMIEAMQLWVDKNFETDAGDTTVINVFSQSADEFSVIIGPREESK